MDSRVVSHASIQFRQDQSPPNFAQSWARNAPFRMPNTRPTQVPRTRPDMINDSSQWEQNRNCAPPFHQNSSSQLQRGNAPPTQYNHDYSDEQVHRQGYNLESEGQMQRRRSEDSTATYVNSLNKEMRSSYPDSGYPDPGYNGPAYSEYMNNDYTFNNHNEYNSNYDERPDLDGHHSAVIHVGVPSDVESVEETYPPTSKESTNERSHPKAQQMQKQQLEEQKKSNLSKYNPQATPNYANHFVGSSRFEQHTNAADPNINQLQLPYKNLKSSLPRTGPNTQPQIQQRHQVEFMDSNASQDGEITDEHSEANRYGNIPENNFRNGHISGNGQEVSFANVRAGNQPQTPHAVRQQAPVEGNQYPQCPPHKHSFGSLPNTQRAASMQNHQVSTNPFAKKQFEKEKVEEPRGAPTGPSVQTAVARFNKVQQNWSAPGSQTKKEGEAAVESKQIEMFQRETSDVVPERRTQTLSLHKKHGEFYENVHQSQEVQLKQRNETVQPNNTNVKTPNNVSPLSPTVNCGTTASVTPQIPMSPATVACTQPQQPVHAKSSPVSTDSALSSDDAFPNPPTSVLGAPFHLKENNPEDYDGEAQLLLCYFKFHRSVLNYLGIGLSESLWAKVDQMPKCKVELKLIEEVPEQQPRVKESSRTTTRDKILRRVSSKSKHAKKSPSKKPKEALPPPQSEPAKLPEAIQPPSIVKPARNNIQYHQRRSESSDDEREVEAISEQMRPRADCMPDDDQQIIQDFEDVSKQMNSSRPNSNSTVSSEKRLPNERDETSTLNGKEDRAQDESSDGFRKTEDAAPRDLDKRSGRFMKKSAAALIARKQTSAANSPVPLHKGAHKRSHTADPQRSLTREQKTEARIAAEIRNMKEREDELRRSRSELGLPSLEDIVDTWKYGVNPEPNRPNGNLPPLRGARSFDHLHAAMEEARCNTEPRVAKSESFHHLQASLGSMGHINKNEEGYYTYESDPRICNYNSERTNGVHKARKVRLADPSPQPANPKVKHVEVKVRPADAVNTGTLNSNTNSNRRGAPPPRLRRNYVEEFPSVRL